nr:hypothetical protein CFP56_30749 [Quercus suber]
MSGLYGKYASCEGAEIRYGALCIELQTFWVSTVQHRPTTLSIWIDGTVEKPRFTALVTVRALEPETNGTADAPQHVLLRIRKILARTRNDGCTEKEMQAANVLANKYMQRYNVTQAHVYRAAAANELDRSKVAGHSHVRINPTKEGGKVCNSVWARDLAGALARLYDCKCYSTSYGDQNRIQWTFYGIAVSTVAAAETFEAVHNTVLDWAARIKKGDKNSYCLGFARGTSRIVEDEKAAEMKLANDAEIKATTEKSPEHLDTATIAQATETPVRSSSPMVPSHLGSPPSDCSRDDATDLVDFDPMTESDLEDEVEADIKAEEDEDIAYEPMDLDCPIEDEIKPFIKLEKPSFPVHLPLTDDIDPFIKLEKPSSEGDTTNDNDDALNTAAWGHSSDLVIYRADANEIAEKYLSQTLNVKLTTLRKARRVVHDDHLFNQGKKDSAHVDIKRKKIADNAAADQMDF